MAIKTPDFLSDQWTGYKVYVTYLALKLHFSGDYDFIRYTGKTAASPKSFETRRDRYQFEKLARATNPFGILLAHLSADPKCWIGNITATSDVYKGFVRRNDALAYTVRSELPEGSLDSLLDILPGYSHPSLLQLHLGEECSLETLCVLQTLYNFIPYWDEVIQDPIVWPKTRLRIIKMLPFLDIDEEAMRAAVSEKIDV